MKKEKKVLVSCTCDSNAHADIPVPTGPNPHTTTDQKSHPLEQQRHTCRLTLCRSPSPDHGRSGQTPTNADCKARELGLPEVEGHHLHRKPSLPEDDEAPWGSHEMMEAIPGSERTFISFSHRFAGDGGAMSGHAERINAKKMQLFENETLAAKNVPPMQSHLLRKGDPAESGLSSRQIFADVPPIIYLCIYCVILK